MNEIDALNTQLSELKTIRRYYEGVWDEIENELFPYRWGGWHRKENKGARAGEDIYDSYPLQMANIATDGIQGHMVSSSFRWMHPHIPNVSADPQTRRWLQDLEDQFYFEFEQSNIYEAINEYIQDGLVIGTAHLYGQEASDGERITFRVMHPREMWIAENFEGIVDTHFREFYLTVKKAVEQFGFYHESVKQMYDHNQLHKEIHFIHAVYPRGLKGSSPDTRPFASEYVDLDNNVIARRGGYTTNPYATWRYRKLSHESYGRGPAWDAIRDIKLLNRFGKTALQAGQRHADPPLMLPSEMKNKYDRRAGAVNYYEDPNRLPFQVNERSNYPIQQEMINEKRQVIRQAFSVDFFLMLQNQTREMTATETIERQNEKVAILGAAIGRFQTEALRPIIDMVYDISYNAGRMPEPPDIVKERYGGKPISIDYTGPLAQAQKRLRMQGTQAALQAALPYAQFDPTMIDRFNFDAVAKDMAESYGMRADAIRTDAEVRQIREQRAQQQQQQAEMEQQESMARAGRDGAQAMSMASQGAQVMQGR